MQNNKVVTPADAAALIKDGDVITTSGFVGIGDFVPTDPERAVHQILKQELAEQRRALDELLRTRVAEFNRLLRERNVPTLISDDGA